MKRLFISLLRSFGYEIHKIHQEGGGLLDPYEIMQALVSDGQPMIFDVGAHVGTTAAYFRSRFPEALIYCFEPFPASFSQLRSAVDRDSLIHCHQLALSSASGSAKMTINESPGTNSLLPTDARGAGYWGRDLLETRGEVIVSTDTLDSFCSAKDTLENPSHLGDNARVSAGADWVHGQQAARIR